jgi:uncharacterized membrane protein YkvA (DUF1232 family)
MSGYGLDDRTPPERRSQTELLGEATLALPRLIGLLYALLRDPRVPRRPKMVAGVVLAYVVSPIDVLPDAIPMLGRLDDVVLVAAAVELLLEAAPEGLIEEHWTGTDDALEIITGLSRFIGGMMPKPVRRFLRSGTAAGSPREERESAPDGGTGADGSAASVGHETSSTEDEPPGA